MGNERLGGPGRALGLTLSEWLHAVQVFSSEIQPLTRRCKMIWGLEFVVLSSKAAFKMFKFVGCIWDL